MVLHVQLLMYVRFNFPIFYEFNTVSCPSELYKKCLDFFSSNIYGTIKRFSMRAYECDDVDE
jgi:hypothetical protein